MHKLRFMSEQLKVYCKNTASYIEIRGGATLYEIYSQISESIGFDPICANVNNRTENLDYPVFSPKQVEFLSTTSTEGKRVYTRSLCMMLYRAICDVAPELSLRIEHSIANGYYCRLFSDTKSYEAFLPDEKLLVSIKGRMREIVDEDMRFVRKERLTTHAIEHFKQQGLSDKVMLFEGLHNLYTVYYKLGEICDSFYGPLAMRTGVLGVFDILPYHEGFLLLGPDASDPSKPAVPIKQEKLYNAFTKYLSFNRIIGVSDVGELNKAVKNEETTAMLINVAEAMHEKYIAKISAEIAERNRRGEAKIVLIAGPSSSGKTTTGKRLSIQLSTELIVPKMISLDDYFIDRAHTPRDESGDYDYENLYALDLELLNKDMNALLRGETVNLPTYSFELGCRVEKEKKLHLGPNDVLVIEGIHGLNPELLSGVKSADTFKLYVSALTTLSIDSHNWISTTDNRLLRRIVRDHKYRFTSAADTIRRWASVRRGEEKWIFPFQENADAMFNSSLIFELGVMRDYVMPLLKGVPRDSEEYIQASRLVSLLEYFDPIPERWIPATSLLREFVGGSSFNY